MKIVRQRRLADRDSTLTLARSASATAPGLRWLAALAVAAVTFLATALPAAAAPNPVTCEGYPGPPRVFLDSQAWWVPWKAGGANNGHVHTSLCFPLHQTVSGTVPLDIRLTMHQNPGKLTSINVQVFGTAGSTVVGNVKFKPALTCPGTCVWWVHIDADTTKVGLNGRHEWRFRPKISQPGGQTMVGSTSYQTYLANSKALVKNYRPSDFLQGKGWYTGASYAIARLDDGFPFAPISAPWTIKFRCESDGPPVSECLVTVDPDFHANNAGTILFQTTSSSEAQRSLVIDPSKFPPGPHKLVIRSSANHVSGSTNAGVLGIPFQVG